MSKKTIFILILILVLAGAGYFFFTTAPEGQGGESGKLNLERFFPFGKAPGGTSGDNQTPTGSGGDTTEGGEQSMPDLPVPQLRKVSEGAVAGATLVGTSSPMIIRYIESGTGHIYDTSTHSLAQKKISNTTIPKIYEALWGKDGKVVIMRYLKDDLETIETFRAALKGVASGGEPQELEGVFFPVNINTISISPSQTRILGITKSSSTGVGTVFDLDGKKVSSFTFPLKEWLSQWYGVTSALLTTKPSAAVPGYAYILNTQTGSLSKVLGGVNGLTALVRADGEKILYGESVGKNIALSLFDPKTGVKEKLPITTLPEKCVWGAVDEKILYCGVPVTVPSGDYPDIWYQGLVSFSDKLWKIDTESGETILLIDFIKSEEDIDLIKPFLSPTEDFLIFTNKKDSTLWSMRLKN